MKRFTEIHMRERSRLLRRARKLAASGNFSRWYEVEFHLRYKDRLPKARDLFEDRSVRSEIDQICARKQSQSLSRR